MKNIKKLVTLIIDVQSSYEFTCWTGDTASMLGNVIVITGNLTIRANFTLKTVELINEVIPEAPLTLPHTSGTPMEVFTIFGITVLCLGVLLKRRG